MHELRQHFRLQLNKIQNHVDPADLGRVFDLGEHYIIDVSS